jgi:hypothetical protein
MGGACKGSVERRGPFVILPRPFTDSQTANAEPFFREPLTPVNANGVEITLRLVYTPRTEPEVHVQPSDAHSRRNCEFSWFLFPRSL